MLTLLAGLAAAATAGLTVLWMDRTFDHVRRAQALAERAALVALRTRRLGTGGSVAAEYALIAAALALTAAGWLGAVEIAIEHVFPHVACTLSDPCMGR